MWSTFFYDEGARAWREACLKSRPYIHSVSSWKELQMKKHKGQGQKLEKRLVLGKETLRLLDDPELLKANGGGNTTASGCGTTAECCQWH
jgi:hypothetical protein